MVEAVETLSDSSTIRSSSTRSSQSSAPSSIYNLTPSQTQAFIEFKELCDKEGQYWPRSKTEDQSSVQSNDDTTLLYVVQFGTIESGTANHD